MTTELWIIAEERENPADAVAGPRKLSEKNHAICESFSRTAETPSPPAQSAHVERREYPAHSASRAAGTGPRRARGSRGAPAPTGKPTGAPGREPPPALSG